MLLQLDFGAPEQIALSIALMLILVLIIRLLGAWMMRINDVIRLQKETVSELKKLLKYHKSLNGESDPESELYYEE